MKSINKISAILALLIIPFFAANATNGVNDDTDENVRTIEMTGTDQMKFDVTEINATPGETIRIEFTTISNLPKAAMSHNVVILDQDADVEAFANASAMARDNEYIAPDLEDQVVAATPLAGGGETVEVTFTVPENAGEYAYICSFPGHYLGGMKGVLKVSEKAS